MEVRQIEKDKWGLFINEDLIGTAKARYDVDFAKQVLLRWKNEAKV
jgi:hypothetical protein